MPIDPTLWQFVASVGLTGKSGLMLFMIVLVEINFQKYIHLVRVRKSCKTCGLQ